MTITETRNIYRKLTNFRQKLHQYPSLSGEEGETADFIIEFLEHTRPFSIFKNIGGYGVAVVYKGNAEGPIVLIRSELDALPIQEISEKTYRSAKNNISHKCGHDGHMAIVAGLGVMIHEKGIKNGTVILLFQPEEETGTGAKKVLEDKQFRELNPDYVFALHNLPGVPLHQVVVKENTFTAASVGITIELKGKTSHAAEPENGISPAMAVSEIIDALHNLPKNIKTKDFSLVTVVHAQIGKRAFGVTPGTATVMATLRSFNNDDLSVLKHEAEAVATTIAKTYNLKINIKFEEHFDATVNDLKCVKIVESAAADLGLNIKNPPQPFRWSEDFGCFTNQYKGALFGLGAGDIPDLHNPDYDFPDELIPTGVELFYEIVQKALQK